MPRQMSGVLKSGGNEVICVLLFETVASDDAVNNAVFVRVKSCSIENVEIVEIRWGAMQSIQVIK